MARMGTISKPVLKHMTDVMPFGEFKDRTVRYILDHRPSYIIWLRDEKVAEVSGSIYQKAERLHNDDLMNRSQAFSHRNHNYSSYYDEDYDVLIYGNDIWD